MVSASYFVKDRLW